MTFLRPGFKIALTAAVIMVLFAAGSAFADGTENDYVYLKAGDRLYGKVISAEGGVLVFSTPYAKEIRIMMKDVVSIHTKDDVRILLDSGELIEGSITPTGEGDFIITRDEGSLPMKLADIKAINLPKSRWSGSVTVGAGMQSGNTDSANASIGAEAVRRTEADRFALRFLYNYAEEDGEVNTRNVFGGMKYDYFFGKSVYGTLGVEVLSDEFKDLNLRTTVSPGVGYQILDKDDRKVAVEGGVSYISEDYDEGQDDNRFAVRGAFDLKWRLFDRIGLTERLAVLRSLEEDEYQLRNEAAITSELVYGWALRLSNIIDYESAPPVDVKDTDSIWTLGLQYSF